jgi:hypothetical protein
LYRKNLTKKILQALCCKDVETMAYYGSDKLGEPPAEPPAFAPAVLAGLLPVAVVGLLLGDAAALLPGAAVGLLPTLAAALSLAVALGFALALPTLSPIAIVYFLLGDVSQQSTSKYTTTTDVFAIGFVP